MSICVSICMLFSSHRYHGILGARGHIHSGDMVAIRYTAEPFANRQVVRVSMMCIHFLSDQHMPRSS